MTSSHICPHCMNRKTFLTKIGTVQTWRVTSDGTMIAPVTTAPFTVTDPADDKNPWTCAVCGGTAITEEEFNASYRSAEEPLGRLLKNHQERR